MHCGVCDVWQRNQQAVLLTSQVQRNVLACDAKKTETQLNALHSKADECMCGTCHDGCGN